MQRIRTAAAIPVEAVVVSRIEPPAYVRIAEKAKHLRELGMSDKAIARAIGVSDKTVAKAISLAADAPASLPAGRGPRLASRRERCRLRPPRETARKRKLANDRRRF